MVTNLYEIETKGKASSQPLRDNFSDIEAALNDKQAQIDNILTPPVGSEVPNARLYHSTLKDRLDSMNKGLANYLKYGGVVSVNAVVTKVDVSAGEAKVDGVDCKWTAMTSGVISPSASGKHRIDTVVIASDSTLAIVSGIEQTISSASPFLAEVAQSQVAIAYIYVDDGAVDNTGNIYVNYPFQGGTLSVLFLDEKTKYITLNAATASLGIDTAWTVDKPLVGTMQLIVTHHSVDCALTIVPSCYHINVDGAVANHVYTMPAGVTKKTIFQIYFDGTSLYVMENPFYVVA